MEFAIGTVKLISKKMGVRSMGSTAGGDEGGNQFLVMSKFMHLLVQPKPGV